MSEISPLYKACPWCEESRKAGLFDEILKCNRCSGTGIVRIPATYICNMCGGELCEKDEHYPSGLVEARVSGGYNSFHLFDCTSYEFSLCEDCLRNKLFPLLKVPPKVFDHISGEDEATYEQDLKQYAHRVWELNDGRQTKLASGLCNYTENCPKVPVWRSLRNSQLGELCVCEDHRAKVSYSYRLAPIDTVPSEVKTEADSIAVANAWLDAPDRFELYVKALREGTLDQEMP